MKRRQFLAALGGAGIAAMAGCGSARGWQQLTMTVMNSTSKAVTLAITIRAGDRTLYDDRLDVGSEQETEFVFAETVDQGTTLSFRVERPATGATATNSWDADVPTWGGDKCMIEPHVQITSEGIDIGPRCVA